MKGQTKELVDGQMDTQIDRQEGELVDRRTVKWTVRNGQMERWKEREIY